jgi:hypothetical protein
MKAYLHVTFNSRYFSAVVHTQLDITESRSVSSSQDSEFIGPETMEENSNNPCLLKD